MTGLYVYRISDLVGSYDNEVRVDGKWLRAVPLPSDPGHIGRLKAAFLVFTGKAHAIQWPEPGDFERAYKQGMDY